MMDWLAHLYVGTLNMIHYMHDNTTTKQQRWL